MKRSGTRTLGSAAVLHTPRIHILIWKYEKPQTKANGACVCAAGLQA